jgi:exodeoxyribonuclease V alpha subunit
MISPHTIFSNYFGHSELKPFLFALSSRMSDGHVCLPTQELPEDDEFWSEYPDGKPVLPDFPQNTEWVGQSVSDMKPLVLHDNMLYLTRYFDYESRIIGKIRQLAVAGRIRRQERMERMLQNKEYVLSKQSAYGTSYERSAAELPDWKQAAIMMAWMNNFTIITGGPGTGKTTTVKRIIELFRELEPGLSVAFAAPTGKAAVRMEESLGTAVGKHKPVTIHVLLGSKGTDSHFFKHNASNLLPYDVIVIDESSMIGAPLFAKLLDAVGEDTRIILLGDSDQLASVDTGSLFGDLCYALRDKENRFSAEELNFINQFVPTARLIPDSQILEVGDHLFSGHLIRLLENFRFRSDSRVGSFTSALKEADTTQISEFLKSNDKELRFDATYNEEELNEFAGHFLHYILEPDIPKALEKLNMVRILCAVRQSEQGVERLNQRVETILKKLLKPHKVKLQTDQDFYEHQPVMVTRNMRELGLSNGDVGIIRQVDGLPRVCFPCKNDSEHGAVIQDGHFMHYKAISVGLLSDRETVFAMTIHKSQGSEFDQILVVLPTGTENRLLTRELLYTALTRVKDKGSIIIQSTADTILRAAERRIKRLSGIATRLENQQ